MSIDQIYEMLQANFDGMVDYAVSHNMPEPVSCGKTFSGKLVMRFEDEHGNRFKAVLTSSLEVVE